MSEKNKPAFPRHYGTMTTFEKEENLWTPGLTVQEFAAIKLRVPDSGCDWLDEMILKSLKDQFAGQALVALLENSSILQVITTTAKVENKLPQEITARTAYAHADAMLAERGKK